MGKPIVLYENVAIFDSATALSSAKTVAGFPAENSLSPFTYPADAWMIERGSSATIPIGMHIYFTSESSFDSVAIVISGIEEGETPYIRVSTGIGGSFRIIFGQAISSNGVHVFRFDEETPSSSSTIYDLSLGDFLEASSDSEYIVVSNITVGKSMEFEKCIMKSYAPLDYNRATEFMTNESGTGQFMGRSIVRRNHESSVSFDLMSAAWVRSTFQPFVRHARTKPYFFAWNYDDYPNEVNYVWTDEDIGVSYTGDRDKMSASWKMRGLGNDQE